MASSPSDNGADERADQCPDRAPNYGHHSDRIEMTQRGSSARHGPVHTQGQEQTSTDRPADHRPPSSALQETCLQLCRMVHVVALILFSALKG